MTVFPMLMNRLRLLGSVTALVVATACGGGAQPGGTAPTDRETLRPEEWGTRNFYSAADAVAALRPLWLNKRGPEGEVQVYIDDVHVGAVEMLRSVRVSSVAYIKHLDGIQASARYGLNHDQGAILITTRGAQR